MAKHTTAPKASNVHAELPEHDVRIPLSDIYVDNTWNARSDLGEASGGPEEGTGLEGLKLSISTKGQDTPVIVRPRLATEKFRQPYFLVAGFRRMRAISEVAADTKDPKPTIRAFIRNMSEIGAREINLRENTARDNLSGPDLAFGVAKMHEAAARMGAPLTQSDLALSLNISQVYVSKLLSIASIKGSIVDGGKTVGILEHWRGAPTKVSIDALYKVSKVEGPDKQAEAYSALLSDKKPDARSAAGKLEQLCKAATKVGTLLGFLVHEDAIQLYDEGVFFDVYLPEFVSLPEDMKANDKRKVREAAEKAFEFAAENGKPTKAAKDEKEAPEDQPSKPAVKGKGKANGKGASAN